MGLFSSKPTPDILPLEDQGSYTLAPSKAKPWNLRIVCISDTHTHHRQIVDLPDGDILIHAGDFTSFGRDEHVADFNAWLGELPHKYKIVAFGNHENNASWHKEAASLLTNAIFLCQADFQIPDGPKVFATNFFHPCPTGNPYFDEIAEDVDIIVAHNPAEGCGVAAGCPSLLQAALRVKPALVVSGHIHFAHGANRLLHNNRDETIFLNAALCGDRESGEQLVHRPIVVDL